MSKWKQNKNNKKNKGNKNETDKPVHKYVSYKQFRYHNFNYLKPEHKQIFKQLLDNKEEHDLDEFQIKVLTSLLDRASYSTKQKYVINKILKKTGLEPITEYSPLEKKLINQQWKLENNRL
jgi:hypothetical protein